MVEHIALLLIAALLVVARRERARLERHLADRDAKARADATTIATVRAALRTLNSDPRTLHRRVVADLTRNA